MTETVLSDDETRTLIDYARQRFAEERWPLSPELRPVRAIMDKLDLSRSPAIDGAGKSTSSQAGGSGGGAFDGVCRIKKSRQREEVQPCRGSSIGCITRRPASKNPRRSLCSEITSRSH